MIRFACFNLLTKCGHCGQAVPVSGPFRSVMCNACFKETAIAPDTLSGLCNDFEEQRHELDSGEGFGGTIMGGGTFDYKVWSMKPRCASCKKDLTVMPADTDASLKCPGCGAAHEIYPAPSWLKDLAPSAVQCYSRERERAFKNRETRPEAESAGPVVMSCPKCGGAMTISGGSERILKCEYCKTDAYVPDPVWNRLHPVKIADEWFIGFEGMTAREISSADRRKDEEEEKEAMEGWRTKRRIRGTKRKRIMAGIFIPIAVIILSISFLMYYSLGPYSTNGPLTLYTQRILSAVAGAGILFATLYGALHMQFAFLFGAPARCKKAMAALAKKSNWKHEAAEYKYCIGSIDDKYKGREIKISPADEYAIEIDLDASPFYLKTEPPGYPHDEVRRFNSKDARFDDFFPVRYAEPLIIRKMESDPDFRQNTLEVFFRFLDRWDGKIGAMKIDWSDLAVHLAPGHKEGSLTAPSRYLYPNEIEPLLEDMIVLARAIDDIKKEKFPGNKGPVNA